METYLSPYVIVVSFLARTFDLLDSIGLTILIEYIVASFRQAGTLSHAIRDTIAAFSVSTPATLTESTKTVVDFSSIGNLTLYSEIARTPAFSAVVITVAIAAAIALNYDNRDCLWRFEPMQAALAMSVLVFSVVAPVAGQQSYWLFVGMALPCIYGKLVRVMPSHNNIDDIPAVYKA
jgi:hypothetical protein